MISGNEGILAFILLLILIAILIRPILNRFEGSKKIFWHSLGGLIPLIILNCFGDILGIKIPINFVTVVIATVFGLPGVILLTILKVILLRG